MDCMFCTFDIITNIFFLFINSPSGQLDTYIKNLERVLDAIDFFNQNNPNCLELSNLVSVLFWIIIRYNMSTFWHKEKIGSLQIQIAIAIW